VGGRRGREASAVAEGERSSWRGSERATAGGWACTGVGRAMRALPRRSRRRALSHLVVVSAGERNRENGSAERQRRREDERDRALGVVERDGRGDQTTHVGAVHLELLCVQRQRRHALEHVDVDRDSAVELVVGDARGEVERVPGGLDDGRKYLSDRIDNLLVRVALHTPAPALGSEIERGRHR
jgi:hypothetical protein